MAIRVTITKALEKKIRALTESGPVMEHAASVVRQLIATMDDALDKQTKKAENRAGSINPNDVINTVKGVLGGKVYCPPNPGSAFYGFVKARVTMLNVSLQDLEKAAVHVRNGSAACRLPTSMEWFMRNLDKVLNEMATSDDESVKPSEESEWEIEIGR